LRDIAVVPKKTSGGMDLSRFVPALLIFIANRLTNSGSLTYRSRCGIGILDFRVMTMLSIEPGVSGARISEVMNLDKAAISRTLKSLERRGLIRVEQGHGRTRVLALSAEGHATYDPAWLIAQERERRLLSPLSSAEQEVLRDLLRRLLTATTLVADLASNGTATAPQRSPNPRSGPSRRPRDHSGHARR
jgi:DNA-binding MarR family transcriptional regulator